MHNHANKNTASEDRHDHWPPSTSRATHPPTAAECRQYGSDCVGRSLAAILCAEQGAILMGMARGWTGLANQMERLENLSKEHGSSILIATEF